MLALLLAAGVGLPLALAMALCTLLAVAARTRYLHVELRISMLLKVRPHHRSQSCGCLHLCRLDCLPLDDAADVHRVRNRQESDTWKTLQACIAQLLVGVQGPRCHNAPPCALQIELTDMVYRKAMQLSGAEVARMGVGGIANLQSNDVQKMSRFRLDINPLWDAPFQVSCGSCGYGLLVLELIMLAICRHLMRKVNAKNTVSCVASFFHRCA